MTLRRALVAVTLTATVAGASARQAPEPDPGLFFQAASRDTRAAEEALRQLAGSWRDGYAAMVLDLVRLLPAPPARQTTAASPFNWPPEELERPPFVRDSGVDPDPVPVQDAHPRVRLIRFLEEQTGQRFGQDLRAWRRWAWALPYEPHARYAEYKGAVFGLVDRRFEEFFPVGTRSAIRLDEIDWGGVGVNGIPPLVRPEVVRVAAASFLEDDHVVFGLAVNGQARAYPKRILAWHEMALDELGGIDLTIVYCTLCGMVVPYETVVQGRRLTFGTSGLLYRSNKLMFDHETMSLWNTFEGRPVVGPLTGSGLRLVARPVVTTTWAEWRAAHPETTVLSLDTGHERNYAEGAAYREYFRTDRLMFEVPQQDHRLKNKAEVFVMSVAGVDGQRVPLAVSAEFLERHPVHHVDVAGQALVIVTSPKGANRAYRAGGHRFARRIGTDRVQDVDGAIWRVTEEALVAEGGTTGRRLRRLPGQRAFWFGWRAQFPDTELIR